MADDVRKEPAPAGRTPVHTIGYGSRSFADFTGELGRYAITCVVDVRSSPYSRFSPDFGKQALEPALTSLGLRYVFLGEALGGRPDDPGCYVDGKVDYERLGAREIYRGGIERVVRAAEQGMRLALLCSEGKPEECHRSKLIGATLDRIGIQVVHIDEQGEPRSQAEIIERLTGGQLSLFGEIGFTSRKRYVPGEPGGES